MVARLFPGCPPLPILVCRVSVHLSACCMWGCVRLGAKPDLAGGKGTVPGMSLPAQGDCPQDVLASLGKCCRGMALGRVENPRAGFKHCQVGLAVSSPEKDSSLNFSWTGIFFNYFFLIFIFYQKLLPPSPGCRIWGAVEGGSRASVRVTPRPAGDTACRAGTQGTGHISVPGVAPLTQKLRGGFPCGCNPGHPTDLPPTRVHGDKAPAVAAVLGGGCTLPGHLSPSRELSGKKAFGSGTSCTVTRKGC